MDDVQGYPRECSGPHLDLPPFGITMEPASHFGTSGHGDDLSQPDGDAMGRYVTLPATTIAGGTAVLIAFWLVQSVLPMAISIPSGIGELIISVAALVTAGLLIGLGRTSLSAAWLFGAGLAWAIHEIYPLSLCTSDALFRPCSAAEISWMVVPAIILLVAALSIVAAHALASRARARD